MEIRFQEGGAAAWQADALVIPVFSGCRIQDSVPKLAADFDWLAQSPTLGDFRGKKDEVALLYAADGARVPRAILSGMGPAEDFDIHSFRLAIASGLKKGSALGLSTFLLPSPVLSRLPGGNLRLIEEGVYAAMLGAYEFTALRKIPDDSPTPPQWLAIGLGEDGQEGATQAAARGERSARAVCLARDLDNMPPNILYPDSLAARASSLAEEKGLDCTVLDSDAISELGMGALLAVGQGSARSPRLVIVHYPGSDPASAPLVYVGKGLTFDSGGISLKPASGMEQMKCDMSGAAACLAAMTAIADEHLPQRVIAVLALAENMPGGRAQRPGDVVRAHNGDTIEIVNTDAEGRMVLCDALSYACREFRPRAIVDVATLTGACAVALGSGLGGLFCSDETLCAKLLAISAAVGEHMWRMPLWQPYSENIRSEIADIRHTGPREGGAITAALFLQHFVEKDVPYAHLDIAGVDWNSKRTPLCPIGATGFSTRTLIELAREPAW